jgi:glycogen synthase
MSDTPFPVRRATVVLIGAEAEPFVKVGGLADVLGSLPKSLVRHGIDPIIILPLYAQIDRERYNLRPAEGGSFSVYTPNG